MWSLKSCFPKRRDFIIQAIFFYICMYNKSTSIGEKSGFGCLCSGCVSCRCVGDVKAQHTLKSRLMWYPAVSKSATGSPVCVSGFGHWGCQKYILGWGEEVWLEFPLLKYVSSVVPKWLLYYCFPLFPSLGVAAVAVATLFCADEAMVISEAFVFPKSLLLHYFSSLSSPYQMSDLFLCEWSTHRK